MHRRYVLAFIWICSSVTAPPAGAQPLPVDEIVSPFPQEVGRFGCSLASLGDLNEDGLQEVAVTACFEGREGCNGTSDHRCGRVYILNENGDLVHVLTSPQPSVEALFGTPVELGGDVDRDGTRDVLVGSLNFSSESPDEGASGRLHVFSGATWELLYSVASPDPDPYDRFGSAAAAVPDVNGDGVTDIVVAARSEVVSAETGQVGVLYFLNGTTGEVLSTLEAPEGPVRFFGSEVVTLPDLNGDGVPDIAVSASGGSVLPGVGGPTAGKVYVYSGSDWTQLYSFGSPQTDPTGHFGSEVADAGDLDGDGVPDLLVGATGEGPDFRAYSEGRVHLFSGADGTPLHTFIPPAEEAAAFGWELAVHRGARGDSSSVVFIAAFRADGSEGLHSGRVYAFDGSTKELLYDVVSPNPESFGGFGSGLAVVSSPLSNAEYSLLVGARDEAASELVRSGRVYVFGASRMTSTAPEVEEELGRLALWTYPNPVRAGGVVRVRYAVAEAQEVTVEVFDELGRRAAEVVAEQRGVGEGDAVWRVPASLPAGLYLVRLQAGSASVARKLLVVH